MAKRTHGFSLRAFISLLFFSLSIPLFLFGTASEAQYYRYIDNDGSIVITDNPPPGAKVKEIQSIREVTEQEKTEWEKEQSQRMQQYREEEAKKREKSDTLKALREELEQALRNEERYRSNMNQAHGFAQRNAWKRQLQEQQKEIEEIRKKIAEIESSP